jgi:hypothetical protein
MPTLSKRDKEIKRAIETLKKHSVSVFTLENKEFLEEWIFDEWQHHNLKPTQNNIIKVREKAIDYILSESWEIMQDAIGYVASKQSEKQKTK